MGTRLELQSLLETLLGSSNVYFQPPVNIEMQYDAIVYKRDDVDAKHADNAPYALKTRYLITVITRRPDNDVHLKIAALPQSAFLRNFVAKNLHHDVLTLYF